MQTQVQTQEETEVQTQVQTQEETEVQTQEETEEQRKIEKRLGKQPITDSPTKPQSPKETTAPRLGSSRKRNISNPMGSLPLRKAKNAKK